MVLSSTYVPLLSIDLIFSLTRTDMVMYSSSFHPRQVNCPSHSPASFVIIKW